MTREDKAIQIEELVEKFKNNQVFYVTDAGGMSVAQVNNFRRMCFNKGLDYKVYKNTLVKKALEQVDGDFTPLHPALKGFSGLLFSIEDGKAPAKLLKEYYKTGGKGFAKPALKGASIDAAVFIGADQLDVLEKIKSKQELLGEVIGLLQSPAKNVISALQSGGNKLAGILKTLGDREAA